LSYRAKRSLALRLGTSIDKLVKEFYSESFSEKEFPVMLVEGERGYSSRVKGSAVSGVGRS
jgi:hypothetical protein